MPVRTADAVWEGSLKGGNGTVRLGSGAFEGQYSFSSRFESGTGTNPEELIGAAHSGCYSMALAGSLGAAGFEPSSVKTTADVHVVPQGAGFVISQIDLRTEANVPGISEDEFQKIAQETKDKCPVSQLVKAAEITLEAKLSS